jgi:two-component system chemotaxis response regulator CheB
VSLKILVVDDSPTVRAVVRRLLTAHEEFSVVEAENGQQAVEAVLRQRPDVVLLDVEMPVMNGLEAMERIRQLRPTPILVLTSRANRQGLSVAFEALQRGALDVLPKPEAPGAWEGLAQRLPELLRTAARLPLPTPPTHPPHRLPQASPRRLDLLLVGASTGGPGALRRFLLHLPPSLQAPIAVVQHISPGFEEGLASWLASETGREVKVLGTRHVPAPRSVVLPPAGVHLVVEADGSLATNASLPPRGGHRPSVDVLFESALQFRPQHTAAFLLSGMGDDGAKGLLALRQAGALTAVQDEASCAVFGMPRQALSLGAAEVALPPEGLARWVAQACGEEP